MMTTFVMKATGNHYPENGHTEYNLIVDGRYIMTCDYPGGWDYLMSHMVVGDTYQEQPGGGVCSHLDIIYSLALDDLFDAGNWPAYETLKRARAAIKADRVLEHSDGGAVGYLHRCSEILRLRGVNPDDTEAVKDTLGHNVYPVYLVAIEEVMPLTD